MSFQFNLDQGVLASCYIFLPAIRSTAASVAAAATTTTTTSVPAATASSSTTAITAATAAAFLTRSGYVHGQISTLKFLPVEQFNGFLGFLVGTHFDKAKAPAFAGKLILHDGHRNHSPCLREEVLQLVFNNRKREIPDKQLGCHNLIPALQSMNVPVGGSQTTVAAKRESAVSESFGSQAAFTLTTTPPSTQAENPRREFNGETGQGL